MNERLFVQSILATFNTVLYVSCEFTTKNENLSQHILGDFSPLFRLLGNVNFSMEIKNIGNDN